MPSDATHCSTCDHVDFAHADWHGCAYGGCDCERVNYGYGWLAPDAAKPTPSTQAEAQLLLIGAELQELCVDAIGCMNKAKRSDRITHHRAMADAYGNAAELLWRRADELAAKRTQEHEHRWVAPEDERPAFVREAEDSGDANGTWRRHINGGKP